MNASSFYPNPTISGLNINACPSSRGTWILRPGTWTLELTCPAGQVLFSDRETVCCHEPRGLPAARSALKTKDIPVTVSAHVIHYGISDGSNTSLITFLTWCACVNPIVIDLIDVKFCDLSRNGGCLHPDNHNVSHQNVTLPSQRKVADTI